MVRLPHAHEAKKKQRARCVIERDPVDPALSAILF
jgi:hypothetical protein